MKAARLFLLALVVAILIVPAFSTAAAVKTYQVTGPVLESSNDMIAVQKGKDRWEIARDSSTKVTGDLKVGSKVTIEYRMAATSVEVKPEKAAKEKTSKKK